MATIKKFEELEIWQLARKLSIRVFAITSNGDFAKDFGLKAQIKNAIGSVMDNIAEGFGRGGNKEFINFLGIATGSCNEVQSQLYRALDWNYIAEETFKELYGIADEIISKTGSLISYLNKTEYKGEKFRNRDNNKQQTTNH